MSTAIFENEIVRFLRSKIENSLIEGVRSFENGETILQDPINNPFIRVQKHMRLEQGLYSPILDIAVGPFAFKGYEFANRNDDNYQKLLELSSVRAFIDLIKQKGKILPNYNDIDFNENPRCLISFEIENANDKKHNIGSMANCSIMGKVGIYIDYQRNRLDNFFNYLNEMTERRKTKLFKNVIFISKDDFDVILGE